MALFKRNSDSEINNSSINNQLFITSQLLDWEVIKVNYNNTSITFETIPVAEYTYIMIDSVNSVYKIGRTTNKPTERLNQLRTANPSIELRLVFPFQQYTEKELHTKFDQYRKDREWFFATKELKEFIENNDKKTQVIINIYKQFQEIKNEL